MPTNPILDALAALDLSTYPYEQARSIMQQFGQFGIIEMSLHAGKSITRGRPSGGSAFTQASELSYKPQQYNDTYQRASTPFNTMFYGSVIPEDLGPGEVDNERLISVLESSSLLRNAHLPTHNEGPQQEMITFGKWRVTEDIPMVAIFYSQSLAQAHSQGQKLYQEFEQRVATLPQEQREASKEVNEFLAEQFSKPSHEFKGDYEYLLSAVFAELAVQAGVAGVYFPSVKAEAKGYNVAISPAYVERCLRLEKVLECRLEKHDRSFKLDPTAFCEVAPGATTFELQPLPADTQEAAQGS